MFTAMQAGVIMSTISATPIESAQLQQENISYKPTQYNASVAFNQTFTTSLRYNNDLHTSGFTHKQEGCSRVHTDLTLE